MRVDTALQIVNDDLVIYPGWDIRAEDHTRRFEDTICIHFNITDARMSERENAPRYEQVVKGGARSTFPIYVGDINTPDELVGRIIDAQIENFTHEVREFTRFKSTGHAPFHPHQHTSIVRWSERTGRDARLDYLFGLA